MGLRALGLCKVWPIIGKNGIGLWPTQFALARPVQSSSQLDYWFRRFMSSLTSDQVDKVHHTFATAGSDGAFNFWDKDSKQRLKSHKVRDVLHKRETFTPDEFPKPHTTSIFHSKLKIPCPTHDSLPNTPELSHLIRTFLCLSDSILSDFQAMSRCSQPIPCSTFNNDGSIFAYSSHCEYLTIGIPTLEAQYFCLGCNAYPASEVVNRRIFPDNNFLRTRRVCYDWSKGAENHNPATAKTYIFLHLPQFENCNCMCFGMQEAEVKGKPRIGTSGRK
ncbi:Protein RAE1 [Vitis vinifera]|uniref:Protein RAE1 n=1 Tax=Vitis vinifera TaxID=29760 RepID=A0A438BXI7_VITVI|nr:Protein RAE1 [Vitis vinifera]